MVHPDSQELDRERSPVPEGYTPYTYEFRDRHGKMQRERLFLKNTPIITESEVEQARIEPERRECLHITLNTQGGKTMKAATSAMNLGRDRLALVVQGKIKSAPVVQAVISRTFEISGLDGKNEASGLAELLNRQAPTEKNTPFIPQDLALYAVHPESRRLVEEGYVSGWDDPRMPTLAGMRRRGYTSAAVRDFIDRVGVSKADSVVDVRLLEYCVRNDLNETAPRVMAVLDPVKVVLTNYEAGRSEDCVIENHPKKPEMGTHTVPLTREIYIEREDFMIDAPKKFFRLKPDGEVRLKGAYIIKCERYDVDENGNVTCIYCSVDFTSKSGSEGADRKVKGTIHWVSAEQNIPFEGRLYDVLMRDDDEQAEAAPEEEADEETAAPAKDFIARLNPDSLKVIHGFAEPYLAQAKVGDDFQFLRMGYFCKDKDSTADMAVFNRVVPLKDSYKPE